MTTISPSYDPNYDESDKLFFYEALKFKDGIDDIYDIADLTNQAYIALKVYAYCKHIDRAEFIDYYVEVKFLYGNRNNKFIIDMIYKQAKEDEDRKFYKLFLSDRDFFQKSLEVEDDGHEYFSTNAQIFEGLYPKYKHLGMDVYLNLFKKTREEHPKAGHVLMDRFLVTSYRS